MPGGIRSSKGATTQTISRGTVKEVERTKSHPRETFDEAVGRLVEDHRVLEEIRRKAPELVESARRSAGAAA